MASDISKTQKLTAKIGSICAKVIESSLVKWLTPVVVGFLPLASATVRGWWSDEVAVPGWRLIALVLFAAGGVAAAILFTLRKIWERFFAPEKRFKKAKYDAVLWTWHWKKDQNGELSPIGMRAFCILCETELEVFEYDRVTSAHGICRRCNMDIPFEPKDWDFGYMKKCIERDLRADGGKARRKSSHGINVP
jgi:hypothetical protein